mmetsp:Transcript_17603/g.22609  ORF Transcript_17603/g.22609 Transcript_17603/m.22609 type:complete len:239 (+) Transcript_17603:89-805(+)
MVDCKSAIFKIFYSSDSIICSFLNGQNSQSQETRRSEESLSQQEILSENKQSDQLTSEQDRSSAGCSTERTSLKIISMNRELDSFRQNLIQGIPVVKHGASGKPKERMLYCDESCTILIWTPYSKVSKKKQNKIRSYHEIRFHDIKEIRYGTDPDRQHPGLAGTPNLRRSAEADKANRCLSIIWDTRTLDLEFRNSGDCANVLKNLRYLWEEICDQENSIEQQPESEFVSDGKIVEYT